MWRWIKRAGMACLGLMVGVGGFLYMRRLDPT